MRYNRLYDPASDAAGTGSLEDQINQDDANWVLGTGGYTAPSTTANSSGTNPLTSGGFWSNAGSAIGGLFKGFLSPKPTYNYTPTTSSVPWGVIIIVLVVAGVIVGLVVYTVRKKKKKE